jgi:hypothetical protein
MIFVALISCGFVFVFVLCDVSCVVLIDMYLCLYVFMFVSFENFAGM